FVVQNDFTTEQIRPSFTTSRIRSVTECAVRAVEEPAAFDNRWVGRWSSGITGRNRTSAAAPCSLGRSLRVQLNRAGGEHRTEYSRHCRTQSHLRSPSSKIVGSKFAHSNYSSPQLFHANLGDLDV